MSNDFVEGTGNIFADLGVKNPEMELAKAELACAIRSIIRERKLTQKRAAALLGTDQAKVSALMGGKVSGYSYDRLVDYLNKLNCDVKIVVTPSRSDRSGKTLVEK